MALLFNVILNTSLCVKRYAAGGECLFFFTAFCLCFCTAREGREAVYIFFYLKLVRAP